MWVSTSSTRFTGNAAPAKTRIFHLFVKDRDLENPAHYSAVTAELRARVGQCRVVPDLAPARELQFELRVLVEADTLP